MKITNNTLFILSGFCWLMLILHGCKKDEEPVNPYDSIVYDTMPPQNNFPDYSIQGLHKNIFSLKCATSGCHDGNFEPDFRTIQSAYSTLVYQKPVKNDSANSFKYRVTPYDTALSWLHERITTDDSVLGRMPLYSNPLSSHELYNINKWILDGAKDIFGNPASIPALPNAPPMVLAYGAFVGNTQIDTNRMNGLSYMPFIINSQTNMLMAFILTDDSTAVSQLQVNQLKISTDKNDFSNAITYQAQYIFIQGAGDIWYTNIDASTLPLNTILYMRYFVNDGNQPQAVEYPNNATLDYYKTYYAFYIVP